MGNGPGGMNIYDELAERYPRLHGGFVWEWRDHGLLTRTPDGIEFYAYGGDFGEVVHDGNFVMDGMLLPDGTPTPSLAEFTRVNQPILFDLDGGGRDGPQSLPLPVHRAPSLCRCKEVDGHPVAEESPGAGDRPGRRNGRVA